MGCVEVDRVFALPLQKDTDLIAVPLNAKIKLQRSKNMEQLENFIEYSRFLEKAQRLLADARDRLQIVDLKLSEKDKKDASSKSGSNKKLITNQISLGLENGYVLRKSASCDSTKYMSHSNFSTIADEYDEIDQIYDYVRGFAPLPKNLNRFEPIPEPHHNNHTNSNSLHKSSEISSMKTPSNDTTINNGNYSSIVKSNSNNNNSMESVKHSSSHHHHHHHYTHHSHHQEDIKPVPPPIETIPGKKLPEKRQRPTLPKLYVKNSNSHAQKAIVNSGQLSSGLIINGKEIEPQSPLFHIR